MNCGQVRNVSDIDGGNEGVCERPPCRLRRPSPFARGRL